MYPDVPGFVEKPELMWMVYGEPMVGIWWKTWLITTSTPMVIDINGDGYGNRG